MENHREDTVVIFAGYPDGMDELFRKNPGLRSRVPFTLTFEDYSPVEMTEIVEMEARKRGFGIRPEALGKVRALCEDAAGKPEMGNGRFCRNLVENALLTYAYRVYGTGSAAAGTELVLEAEDFQPAPGGRGEAKRQKIGFSA